MSDSVYVHDCIPDFRLAREIAARFMMLEP
jgi:hypothetical protein